MILPAWVTAYRKALVLSAVAVTAGGAAWTAQGWRMGKQLAQVQTASQAANVRRQAVVIQDWNQAAIDVAAQLRLSKDKLRAQRLANAAMLAKVRLASPQGPEYACRSLPLPASYLEKFRP